MSTKSAKRRETTILDEIRLGVSRTCQEKQLKDIMILEALQLVRRSKTRQMSPNAPTLIRFTCFLLLTLLCRPLFSQDDFSERFEKLASSQPANGSPLVRFPTTEELELLNRFAAQPYEIRLETLKKLIGSETEGIPVEYVAHSVALGNPKVSKRIVEDLLLPHQNTKEISDLVEDRCARIFIQLSVNHSSEWLNGVAIERAARFWADSPRGITKNYWKERTFDYLPKLPSVWKEKVFHSAFTEFQAQCRRFDDLEREPTVDKIKIQDAIYRMNVSGDLAIECTYWMNKRDVAKLRSQLKEVLGKVKNAYNIRRQAVFSERTLAECRQNTRSFSHRTSKFYETSIYEQPVLPYDKLISKLEDESLTLEEFTQTFGVNSSIVAGLKLKDKKHLAILFYKRLLRHRSQDDTRKILRALVDFQTYLDSELHWRLFEMTYPSVSASTGTGYPSTDAQVLWIACRNLQHEYSVMAMDSIFDAEKRPKNKSIESNVELICQELPPDAAKNYLAKLKEWKYYKALLKLLEDQPDEIRELEIQQLIEVAIADKSRKKNGLMLLRMIASSDAASPEDISLCLQHGMPVLLNNLLDPTSSQPYGFFPSKSFTHLSDAQWLDYFSPILENLPNFHPHHDVERALSLVSDRPQLLSNEMAEQLVAHWLRLLKTDEDSKLINGYDLLIHFALSRPKSEHSDYLETILRHYVDHRIDPTRHSSVGLFSKFQGVSRTYPHISSRMGAELFDRLADRCLEFHELSAETLELLVQFANCTFGEDSERVIEKTIQVLDKKKQTTFLTAFASCLATPQFQLDDEKKLMLLDLSLENHDNGNLTYSLQNIVKSRFSDAANESVFVKKVLNHVEMLLVNEKEKSFGKIDKWLYVLSFSKPKLTSDDCDRLCETLIARQKTLNRPYVLKGVFGQSTPNTVSKMLSEESTNPQAFYQQLSSIANILNASDAKTYFVALLDQSITELTNKGRTDPSKISAIYELSRSVPNGAESVLDRLVPKFGEIANEGSKGKLADKTLLAIQSLTQLFVQDQKKYTLYYDKLKSQIPDLHQLVNESVLLRQPQEIEPDELVSVAESLLVNSELPSERTRRNSYLRRLPYQSDQNQVAIVKRIARSQDLHNKFQFELDKLSNFKERLVPLYVRNELLADPEIVGLSRTFVLSFFKMRKVPSRRSP